MPPKKKAAKKATPVETENTDIKGTLWQWYDDGDKDWIDFAQADSKLFETRFAAATAAGDSLKFQLAKELSFNKKHGTKYTFDLTGPSQRTQKNEESGTVKKLRRLVDGAECYKLPAEPKKSDRDDSGDENASDSEKAPCKKAEKIPAPGDVAAAGSTGTFKTPFWNLKSSNTVEEEVTDDMVKQTEKLLGGKKLPASFINLLKSTGTNGGSTNNRHVPHLKKNGSPCEEYHFDIDGDGGNGYRNFDVVYGLDGGNQKSTLGNAQSVYLDDQDYPDIGIYFCDETEFSANGAWCWDYRKCGPKGEPSVAYVDFEDQDPIQIADNFQEFLNMLAGA